MRAPKIALSFIIKMTPDAVQLLQTRLSSSLKRDTRPYIRALATHDRGLAETDESQIRRAREMIFPINDGIAVRTEDHHPVYAAALCVLALSVIGSDDVITFGASVTHTTSFPYQVEAAFYAANAAGFTVLRLQDVTLTTVLKGELAKRTGRTSDDT